MVKRIEIYSPQEANRENNNPGKQNYVSFFHAVFSNKDKNYLCHVVSSDFFIKFALSNQLSGQPAQILEGLFFCPTRYGGGYLTSRKGNPEIGFDSVRGHRFLIGHCQKSSIMNNLNPVGPMDADQIIEDLILTDEMPRMRMHLRSMADSYLLAEDEASYRHGVWDTYKALDILLARIENLKREKERRAA